MLSGISHYTRRVSTNAPRRRDKRHERHDRTLTEILDVAWEIARNDGVGAVSLREVARAFGVQPQSLYTYVESKNGLFDAMFKHATADLLALLDEPPGDTAEQRLRTGCQLFVRHCVAHPERFTLLFQRPVPGFVPSAASMQAAGQLLQALASALTDAGSDDSATLDLFTAGLTGLISQQVSNDPHGDRWTKLLDRLITALLTA